MKQMRKTKTGNEPAPGRKDVKKSSRRNGLSGALVLFMLGLTLVSVAALAVNLVRVNTVRTGEGNQESMSVNTDRSMKNSKYQIGNNPTEIGKTYFQELTDSLKSNDDARICEAVVKNFVTEYFTWTNKDGNYEVGGLQYIYGPKFAVFEEWSRYNYYADLDLYISKYGREKLLQVKEITVDKPAETAPDFATTIWTDDTTKEDVLFDSYEVNVSWTYEPSSLDTSEFVSGARFFLVNNDGRWEIAEFYDYDSIHEWEVENGLAAAERSLS